MEIDDKRYKYIYGMANKAIDSPMSHLMPTTKQSPASHVSMNAISSMYFKRITDLLFFFMMRQLNYEQSNK